MSQPDFFQLLTQKFPEMQPVTKPPSLSTVNGIGTNVFGRRDFDQETGTYVTTMWLCLLLPLLALRAYRVADAPNGGWYFLGRVPISGAARNWNWLLVIGLLTGASGLYYFIDSRNPNTIAGRQVAAADSLAAEGKVGQAAEMLLPVARGTSSHANSAKEKIGQLLDSTSADPAELTKAFAAAVDLQRSGRPIDRVIERGLERIRKLEDPAAALKLSDTLKPIAQDAKKEDAAAFAQLRIMILEQLVKTTPNDLDVLSELAVSYEARREFDKCEKLLEPHAAKLGTREGARVLGQIYAQKDKIDQAHDLLAPYSESKLKRLEELVANLKSTQKRIDDANVAKLQAGNAKDFNFQRHKTASKAVQQEMMDNFLDNLLRNDPDFLKAQNALLQESQVVNVALDLGVIFLKRGQAKTDPATRKVELEKAEKAFLSVSGLVGHSDDYLLNLGQVYYWLGRQAEGKKQFDDLLQTHQRKPMMLLMVARLLREVGNVSEARPLAEEAYAASTNAKEKYFASGLRGVMGKDQEDRITWLKRGDPDDKHSQAQLKGALGDMATIDARYDAAAGYYKEVIELLASLSETSSTLNNAAVACQSLYHVTGDRRHFEKAVAMFEKAVNLGPRDSIPINNLAEVALENALWDVIGNKIDLQTLRQTGAVSLFEFLCDDAQDRDAYRAKVRADPGVAKARAYFERALLLAPKSPRAYGSLARLHGFTQDLPALRDLLKRLESVDLDLTDIKRQQIDNFQGKDDARLKKENASSASRLFEELNSAQKVGGPTWAVAAYNWSNSQSSKLLLGVPLSNDDTRNLIKLADDVGTAAPSFGSRRSLMADLLLRAHCTLVEKEPAYAALAKKGGRTLGPSFLIAFALSTEGPAQKACLQNDDVQRVAGLLRELLAKNPSQRTAWDWAMLRTSHPEDAARIAKDLPTDEAYRLNLQISEKTSALSPVNVMNRCFILLMEGDEPGARAVLEQAIRDGIPLPKR